MSINRKFTLAEHRRLKNFTKKEIAAKIGVSSTLVGLWESNKVDIRLKHFYAYINILEITPDDVYLGNEYEK